MITGNAGNNTLSGLGGNDTLIGGSGNDTMAGDAGNDTYVFRANFGHDTITSFGDAAGNQDILDVTGVFANFAAVQAVMQQTGLDVHIGDVNNDIILKNVTLANLGADDFRFVEYW